LHDDEGLPLTEELAQMMSTGKNLQNHRSVKRNSSPTSSSIEFLELGEILDPAENSDHLRNSAYVRNLERQNAALEKQLQTLEIGIDLLINQVEKLQVNSTQQHALINALIHGTQQTAQSPTSTISAPTSGQPEQRPNLC
jgi:exonuclease VII small subunit